MSWTKSEVLDPRRWAVALFVLLLHAAVIALVVRTFIVPPPPIRQTHEIMLQFSPPAAPPQKRILLRHLPAVRLTAPSMLRFAPMTLPPPDESNEPSLQGLYFYLYDCAPENFSHLSESERQRCAMASIGPRSDDTNALRNGPSHARDAVHWGDALAREKQPFGMSPLLSDPTEKSVQKMLKCPPPGSPVQGPADVCGDLGNTPGYRDSTPDQNQ